MIEKLSQENERGVDVPPELMVKWQTIVDTMAQLFDVPAGLIMSLEGDAIKVSVASRSAGNPYHVGESDLWHGSGLYCETVIDKARRLLVPDALADADWCRNPDVPRGMISYLGYPIRWPDGRPFGTICVLDNKRNAYNEVYERLIEQFRDMIESHLRLLLKTNRQERTISEERAGYAAELARTRSALLDARAALADASRASEIEHFARVLMHEVNQPLAAVAISAATGLRWLERDVPDVPAACATLRLLAEANRRAADVVANLRSLAQKSPIAPRSFDLRKLVLETLSMFREQLDRAGIVDKAYFEDPVQPAFGERVQVQLVLHNLVKNAIEAMANVSDRERRLTISTRVSSSGGWTIVVADSGIGLAPTVAAQIMKSPFTTKTVGMGLGLMICRSIIEAHGGALTGSAGPDGEGALFTFDLPPEQL